MPFDGNQWDREKTVSAETILSTVQEKYGLESINKIEDKPNATSRNYAVSGALGSFGTISTVTNPFCDTCNRIRLTADGKIKNCLFSSEENDVLSTYRSGQSIIPVVASAIKAKKKGLGGLNNFDNNEITSHKNRSMIAIGG